MRCLILLLNFSKEVKRYFYLALLSLCTITHFACKSDINNSDNQAPFLNIDNGQFDVDVVFIQNSAEPAGESRGSGSLSFDFSGDTTGTFSASGELFSNQTGNDAVGAIVDKIFDEDIGTLGEGFSLLAFHPVGNGNGKADVFLLGTKIDTRLDSLQADVSYQIGPFAPFNGLYLKGVNITEFWAGQSNFINTSDRAFILLEGIITIAGRDSSRVTGTFFGTTHAEQTNVPKYSMLR